MKLYRERGFYEKYVKRVLDVICSLLALAVFSWLYLIIALMVCIKMGRPVIFKQPRPGMIDKKTGNERIFNMYKFRTMTNDRGADGEFLPDEERLPEFGKLLRRTSLDELPEVFNILKGDMSVIGPRPQLVRDMVFMSDEQRMRHTAKPGLSGLAQVMGRNAITWEDKIAWDLKYIEKVDLLGDLKIIGLTVRKVFGKGESGAELDVADDYGDALLKAGNVTQSQYNALQVRAKNILAKYQRGQRV